MPAAGPSLAELAGDRDASGVVDGNTAAKLVYDPRDLWWFTKAATR